jgi:hypothetical protein
MLLAHDLRASFGNCGRNCLTESEDPDGHALGQYPSEDARISGRVFHIDRRITEGRNAYMPSAVLFDV